MKGRKKWRAANHKLVKNIFWKIARKSTAEWQKNARKLELRIGRRTRSDGDRKLIEKRWKYSDQSNWWSMEDTNRNGLIEVEQQRRKLAEIQQSGVPWKLQKRASKPFSEMGNRIGKWRYLTKKHGPEIHRLESNLSSWNELNKETAGMGRKFEKRGRVECARRRCYRMCSSQESHSNRNRPL